MNSSFDIVIIDKNILYDSVSKKYYITDSVNNRLNDYFISSLDFQDIIILHGLVDLL